ncbi:MAG: AarF/ABC1/UbiB kinase family protein [Deltaproteobacteria bacterium]|nr:AarF/ABC1/UbiB kinase family protein [Deltaproteobacteria bacterium]
MTREPAHDRSPEDLVAESAERVAEIATGLLRNVGHHVRALVEDAADDSRDVAREAEAFYDSAGELFDNARDRLEEARDQLSEAGDVLRAAPRAARIVRECLALLARHRIGNAVAAARSELTGQPAPTNEALHRHTARRLRILCEDLRGGVLKLGQFVSTRGDLLPEPYLVELSKLQDRVAPIPAEAVASRLQIELGPDWGNAFASFEPEPLAAASLAQVHGATLADGTPVAVKLLVPGIEATVEADLAALRLLEPSLRERLHRIDLETLVAELSRSVLLELDLEDEARAAIDLRAAFAEDPDVIVPEVYTDASSRGVLVMERIEGERLIDFLDGCRARGSQGVRDRDRLFEILIRSFCEQVLVHGIFQGDPHPGNFLVVPGPDGPRLALIDFGCIERYDADTRARYAALALATLARDEARMVELFEEIGFRSRDGDAQGLQAYAELFLSAFREGVSADDGFDHAAQIERIRELTDADPIAEIPPHFVLLGRVFASLGGLLARYQPQIQLSGILRPGLASALRPG